MASFVETHYVYSPQLIFIQRSEWVRMSQQAFATTPVNLGNIDNYIFGFRWYAVHDQPGGVCLAQRIFLDPWRRALAPDWDRL